MAGVIGRSRFTRVFLIACLCFSGGSINDLRAEYRDFSIHRDVAVAHDTRRDLLWSRLKLVLAQHHRNVRHSSARCQDGEVGACRLQDWERYISSLRRESEEEQIRQVNRYMNGLRFVSDARNWRRPDYWATPEELFDRGGDCEDFAIAKYVSLRALGVSPEKLRIVVVQDLDRQEAHAVLLVIQKNGIAVLDNLRRRILRWEDVRDDYRPFYSLNETGVAIHHTGGS